MITADPVLSSDRNSHSERLLQRPLLGGFLSVGIGKHALAVFAELGGDAAALLRDINIDPRIIERPGNRISLRALSRIMQLCAQRSACPHFGLIIGAKVRLDALGSLGSVLRSAETVDAVFHQLEAGAGGQPGAIFALEEDSDVALLNFLPYDPEVEGVGIVSEAVLATVVSVMRELSGSDWRPLEVLIPRRTPANAAAYRTFFRAPVRFDQETAALLIPTASLGTSLEISRKSPFAGLEPDERGAATLVDRVRQHLRREMLHGPFKATQVAKSFDVHRRTLNRRLRAEGASLRGLVDEVRFAVARQLVADTDIPLAQVSAALHFSEPAAFTRAFERWSGACPSSLRTRQARASET